MEGVIDHAFRELYSSLGGYDEMVTEFLRVTDQVLPKKIFLKHSPELLNKSRSLAGTPVVFQLLGGQPHWVAENASLAAELGASQIDLNFGCPAATVNRHDGGAALLKNPSRVYEVTKACVDAVQDRAQISAKIRLGYDHKEDFLSIALAAEQAGAHRLTVHARTKREGYSKPAHWEYIALIREKLKIPVVANGEIWNLSDFKRCREVTGCEEFMLGRGAIANPFLATEIKQDSESTSWTKALQVFADHTLATSQTHPSGYAINRGKQWLRYMALTFPEALDFFSQFKRVLSTEEMVALLAAERRRVEEMG